MPVASNIRITFGLGVGAELREEVNQTIGIYGKTVEIVANQQLQPLKQRHFVKLIREILAAHPITEPLHANFSIQLINELQKLPNALSRFMAIESAKEKTKGGRPTNFISSFLGAVTSQGGIQTRAESYDSLDSEIHRTNREKFKQATLPQLPQPKLTGVEILGQFNRIISSFNLDNPAAPNYLPITFVNPEAKTTDNNRVLVQESIDRASIYLKTLYELPLLVGQGVEHKPKEEEISPLKQGLEAIFAKLEHADDPSVRAMNMGLLISGLIHCSSGQKEGIDTVLKTVVYNENAASSGIEEQIKMLIALRKEDVFKQIVLEPLNPENNHITSFYKHALREELGLFSSSENYRETNHQRNDQYEGNPDVVVARFYKIVTPEFLARLIFGSVENREDKRLKAQISYAQQIIQELIERQNVQKKIMQIEAVMKRVGPVQAEQMRAQITKLQKMGGASAQDLRELASAQIDLPTLKQQLALNKKARPISTGDIIQYLTNRYHVDYMNEEEKDEFFRAYLDRSINDESAILTPQGAHSLCVDLGYVFDGTDERQLTEAIRISFEDGVPKRKLARENQRIMDEFHGFQETITADYVAFKSPDKTASKAVLYLGHLREELVESLRRLDGLKDDEYEIHLDSVKVLSRKILAIIIQGQGVGGLSTRIATPAEASIIGDVFAMAMRKAAPNIVKSYIQSKDIAKLSPDAQKHEKIIWVKTQVEELKKDSEWAGSDLSGKVRLVHSKMDGVFSDIGDDIVAALVR
jgi:hypothetical protein